jgi:hypothetical protein
MMPTAAFSKTPFQTLPRINEPGVIEGILEALRENRLDVNATNEEGMGWLHVAANSSRPESLELVEALIGVGFDADGLTPDRHEVSIRKGRYRTAPPLDFALGDGHVNNIHALIAAGAALPDPDLLLGKNANLREHPLVTLIHYRRGPAEEIVDLWLLLTPSKNGKQGAYFDALAKENVVIESLLMTTPHRARMAEFQTVLEERDVLKEAERLDTVFPVGRRPSSPRHL